MKKKGKPSRSTKGALEIMQRTTVIKDSVRLLIGLVGSAFSNVVGRTIALALKRKTLTCLALATTI